MKLDDTPLEVIESTFVAPDITEDMYDGPLMDDTDYSEFLTGLMKYDIGKRGLFTPSSEQNA